MNNDRVRFAAVLRSADAVLDHFVKQRRKAAEPGGEPVDDPAAWHELLRKYWESPIGRSWSDIEAAIFQQYTHTARPRRFAEQASWGNTTAQEAA